jgi:soluble lytic murein transglycosylase-like protein
LTKVSSTGDSAISAYQTQIDALKNAPGATQAYDAALDAWMQQIQAASQPAPTDDGDDAPADSGSSPPAGGTSAPPPDASTAPPKVNDLAVVLPAKAVSGSAGLDGLNLPSELKPYAADIEAAAQKYNVPASILAAQIMQESTGNASVTTNNPGMTHTDASGHTVANKDVGLMQVDTGNYLTQQGITGSAQTASAHDEAAQKLTDPATNIDAGAKLLSQTYSENGNDWKQALNAYNGVDSGYYQKIQDNISSMSGSFQIT